MIANLGIKQICIFVLCVVFFSIVGCDKHNSGGGIIAMTPALAECVWAVDPGPEHPLIAVNDYTKDSRADGLVKLSREGSIERIVSMHPETVLLQRGDELLAEKLQKMQVPTRIFPMDTVEDVENTLLNLGQMFKCEKNAQHQIQAIRDKLAENSKKYNIGQTKRTLIIIDRVDMHLHSFYIAEPSSYISQLAAGCGIETIRYRDRESAWSMLDAETLIDMNPEYIIFLAYSPQDAREIDKSFREIYSELNAVRNNHLLVYDDPAITIPGPDMGIQQEKLCQVGNLIMKESVNSKGIDDGK